MGRAAKDLGGQTGVPKEGSAFNLLQHFVMATHVVGRGYEWCLYKTDTWYWLFFHHPERTFKNVSYRIIDGCWMK